MKRDRAECGNHL